LALSRTLAHLVRTVASTVAVAGAVAFAAAAQEPAERYDHAALLETGPLEDRVQGEPDAPVTIIEYASMTCPHCAAFHENVYPGIKENYIDTGKARLIFREYPLDRLAVAASMLARCVDEDRFFPFIAILFDQRDLWVVQDPVEPLKNLAKQAGLNDEAFDKCLSNQELLDGIDWIQSRGGTEFDVGGTPSFFVNGEFVAAERAQSVEQFSEIIEKHLGE
jgi:protein-disulfide isomerase